MEALGTLTWTKSTMSGSDDCIEWALDHDGDHILIRDSRDPEGPRLRFTIRDWRAFVGGAKLGEADL